MAGVSGARRAGSASHRFFAATRWPDVLVFSETRLDDALVSSMTADPRAKSVSRGLIVLAAPLGMDPGLEVTTMVLPDERWGRDTALRLVDGRYPLPGARDEVVVNEAAVKTGSLAVGKSVDLELLTPAALTACLRQEPGCEPTPAGSAQIVGVARTPQDLTVDAYSGTVLYARPEFTAARGGPDIATGHLVFINLRDGADADKFAADWSRDVPQGDMESSRQERRALDRASELQRPALLVGAAIAAVAGAIVVGQAMARLLARRRGDVEVLAGLGLTRRGRTGVAVLSCVPSVVLGSMGAVLVAIALSPAFPLRVLRRADPGYGVNADWVVLGVGAGVTLVAGVALSTLAAWRWAGRPRMHQVANVSAAASIAAGLALGPVPATGTRFALERGRGVHAVPVVPALVGALLGLTATVGAFVVRSSIDGLLATPARYGAPWDLQVGMGGDAEQRAAQVAGDDRIARAALTANGELDIEAHGHSEQVAALGYEAVKGSLTPVVLAGRFIDGPDEVVVASDTMHDLDLALGDQLVVSGPGGSSRLTVVGRVVKPIAGDSNVNEGVIVPRDLFVRVGGTDLTAEVDEEAWLLADVRDAVKVDEVAAAIAASGSEVERPFRQSEVTVLREVRAVPLMLAIFTGLLGAVAAAHALVSAARRRRRDLAVLRALGLRPRQTAGIIRWQGLVVAVVALTAALPLGAIVGSVVWRAIATRLRVIPVVDVPWRSLTILAVATVVGAVLVAVLPGVLASRQRPATALHDE